MWVIRNKNTHDLVCVADEKPSRDDHLDRHGRVVRGPTPWEDLIQGDEEIVELPGTAASVHAAVDALGGEVATVKVDNNGNTQTTRSTVNPKEIRAALAEVLNENTSPNANARTMMLALLKKLEGSA